TIEASTSTEIVNAVTTRTTSENGVRSSLSTRLVNQRKPKPASKEVSVVSWVVAWRSTARRSPWAGFSSVVGRIAHNVSRQRPRRRAAEQRDERAPFQLIEEHSVPCQPGPDCRLSNWRGSVRR